MLRRHLIYLSFWNLSCICSQQLRFVSFANTPSYSCIFAPWNAGSSPEGKLAQVSILVPDQLEVHAHLGRGGRDWDGRDTNSLAADAASSTSERIERTERIESGGGKKSKMQQNYLSVTSDDLWRFRDKLSGKWSNLAKT